MNLSPIDLNAPKKAAAGLALAILGAAAAFYAPSIAPDEKSRAWVRIGGIAGIAGGLFLLTSNFSDAVDLVKAQAANGGGLFGAAGKLIFGQLKPGVTGTAGTTLPAAGLGKPKNIQGLAGAFTQPLDGGEVSRDLFSDVYTVKLAIANNGSSEVVSPVRILVHEEQTVGGSADTSIDSDPQTFPPSSTQTIVTLSVPVALSTTVPFEDIDVTLRAYVAGYLVAGPITFTRS